MKLRPDRAGLADWLAGIAAHDPPAWDHAHGGTAENIEESGLDMRTHALVRLAALVALGESATVFEEHVAAALGHGVTLDEIVGVLVALLPTAGPAKIAGMAPVLLDAIDRVVSDQALD